MIRYIINRNGSGKNIKYETWYAPHSSYRDVWSSNYASHRNEWAHIYMLYDKLDQLSHCHTWSRLKDGNQPLYICENDNIKISPLNTCFCFPVIRVKRKYNGKSDNFPVVVITDYRNINLPFRGLWFNCWTTCYSSIHLFLLINSKGCDFCLQKYTNNHQTTI